MTASLFFSYLVVAWFFEIFTVMIIRFIIRLFVDRLK